MRRLSTPSASTYLKDSVRSRRGPRRWIELVLRFENVPALVFDPPTHQFLVVSLERASGERQNVVAGFLDGCARRVIDVCDHRRIPYLLVRLNEAQGTRAFSTLSSVSVLLNNCLIPPNITAPPGTAPRRRDVESQRRKAVVRKHGGAPQDSIRATRAWPVRLTRCL